MLIVQSLANLREVYGADGAANFMGNCELQLFMAPTDADTPRYVSEGDRRPHADGAGEILATARLDAPRSRSGRRGSG